MPRPIPENVETVTGWSWYLLPVPDHPVFVEAAWDAFSELAHPWNWGKEGRVPDSDIAAQLWADAIYEALRIRDMGFPDSILDYIDEVEALLQQILQTNGCCSNIGATDEAQTFTGDYPTTAPATWGDGEAVTDSADWQQLVCGAAHAYVDHLKDINDQLEQVIAGGAIVIGAIAGLLGLLTGAGVLAAVSWGTASGVLGALVALGSGAAFSGVDDALEAARADITCAIWGDGTAASLSSAVEAAVGTLAWSSFYSWIDYETALATMLTGSLGSQHLPVSRRSDCSCAGTPLGAWDWGSAENGQDGWSFWDSNTTLATNALLRYSNQQIAHISDIDVTGLSAIEFTVLASRSGSAGAMDLNIGYGMSRLSLLDSETVSVTGTGGTEGTASEHTVTLDISARTGDLITLVLTKVAGSTGYPIIIYEATATGT